MCNLVSSTVVTHRFSLTTRFHGEERDEMTVQQAIPVYGLQGRGITDLGRKRV